MADHLLPLNATADEKAIASALSRMSDVPIPIRELWNPDTCPADMLPWLAWALSVDVWSTQWPEAKKRQVIKTAITVHRHKGTPFAVEEALASMNFQARVKEWFEYGGEPYKFRVGVDVLDEGLDQRLIDLIGEVVGKTKNVRSHLDGLDIYLTTKNTTAMIGVIQGGADIEIRPWQPEPVEIETGPITATCIAMYTIINIGAE